MAKIDIDNALRYLTKKGHCPALVFDDNGKWCLVSDGFQQCQWPLESSTFFFNKETQWRKTPELAVRAYCKKNKIDLPE